MSGCLLNRRTHHRRGQTGLSTWCPAIGGAKHPPWGRCVTRPGSLVTASPGRAGRRSAEPVVLGTASDQLAGGRRDDKRGLDHVRRPCVGWLAPTGKLDEGSPVADGQAGHTVASCACHIQWASSSFEAISMTRSWVTGSALSSGSIASLAWPMAMARAETVT